MALVDNLESPEPGEGDVLVRVHTASVNPYDRESADGVYDGYYDEFGVQEPVRTGLEFSGEVVSQGAVFGAGDRVYGYVHLITGWKTHAEFITVPESYLAPIPEGLKETEAAALPLGILTSLNVFEDMRPVTGAGRVLIIGAAGGIGVYAVQVAKALGYEITALCSPVQRDFVAELGADHLPDFDPETLDGLPGNYDIILDLSTRFRLDQCESLLSNVGKFVPALPDDANGGNSESVKVGYLMVMEGDGKRLEKAADWIASGDIKPVIDQVYSFSDHLSAFDRLNVRGKKGRIIMTWAK
ncbi:NAD(P)-dependent alcohol dehydrogenase [Aestuariispira insulae]|nr:NAD(P)-dependent alcohol dehydrogenase [Aestuariispira insulae]